jgi:flavin-dependent dehydrogenase
MKSSPRPTRVAIIGAGPAGATTALLPARRGASVVLLDDGRRLELVVCESLVPRLTEIFQRLGIEEQVRALGVRKPGVTFAFDDGDDFELSFSALRGVLPNYAYNVPRREFDQFLLDTALAAGASYVETVAKLDADPALDSVCLAPETLARTPAWDGATPDVIIDASGRRRLFAKLLGISAETGPRRDISHFAHYENAPWPEPHGQVVIGRLEHGWSWRIPLPGPRLSIGVVLPKERAQRFGTTPEEQLEKAIAHDARLAAATAERRRVSSVATYANYQLISARGSGAGWAMVGDAFGFVDPMLSPGLCMAMSSAERLAAAIPAHGGATPELDRALNLYWRWFRDQLTAWQDLVEHFYDGRIFAIHRAGSAFSQKHPGILSRLLERHTAKHFSGMASGALTARPYSRGLLRFLGRHFARGSESGLFAIR